MVKCRCGVCAKEDLRVLDKLRTWSFLQGGSLSDDGADDC